MAADPPASRTLDRTDYLPAGVDDALIARRVIPLRHPWRWSATAVVLVLVAQFATA